MVQQKPDGGSEEIIQMRYRLRFKLRKRLPGLDR
jgi:hypothetical protein